VTARWGGLHNSPEADHSVLWGRPSSLPGDNTHQLRAESPRYAVISDGIILNSLNGIQMLAEMKEFFLTAR